MIKEYIVDFLTISGGFAAIGALLDNIFLDSKRRQLVYKAASGTEAKFSVSLKHYIDLAYNLIFVRFFGQNPTHSRYIIRASIISISFVIVVFSIQVAKGGKIFSGGTVSFFEIIFLFFLIFSNIVIDWMSIYQTQVFMSFSSKSESIIRAFIAIISDIFVSIKLFMFVYSAFIWIILYIFVIHVINPDLKENPITLQFKIIKSESEEAARHFSAIRAFEYNISMHRIDPNNNKQPEEYMRLRVFSVNPIFDPKKLLRHYTLFGEVGENTLFLGEKGKQIEDQWSVYRRIERENNIRYGLTANIIPKELKIDRKIFSNIWYNVDLIEDAFLNIISLRYISMNIEGILGFKYGYSPYFGNNLCFFNWGIIPDGPALKSFGVDRSKCDPHFFGVSGYISSGRTALFSNNNELLKAKIPLNTFFMSSMLLTVVMYFFILSFFIFRYLSLILKRIPERYERGFLKAPFAIVGFVSGLIVWMATL